MSWHPHRFDRPGQLYAELAGLMAMSNSSARGRFCRCCIDFKPCGLVKLCPYCAHRRRMKILKTFVPLFAKVPLYFLTISFNGHLSFLPGEALVVEVYWDASVRAIKQMVQDGTFQGAFWSEELAITSLVPLRVLPHVHVVVAADHGDLTAIDDLKDCILAYREEPCGEFTPANLDPSWFQVSLEVSTRTYPIQSEMDCANILAYMAKTIPLAERYVQEYAAAAESDPARIAWLNESVDIFLSSSNAAPVFLGPGITWSRVIGLVGFNSAIKACSTPAPKTLWVSGGSCAIASATIDSSNPCLRSR